jgi:hypothetical protein
MAALVAAIHVKPHLERVPVGVSFLRNAKTILARFSALAAILNPTLWAMRDCQFLAAPLISP